MTAMTNAAMAMVRVLTTYLLVMAARPGPG